MQNFISNDIYIASYIEPKFWCCLYAICQQRMNGSLFTIFCYNTCYLLRNLYFFFFWDITQQYHEKSLYILAVVIVLVNIFQLYIAVCHFYVIFFMIPINIKRKLSANNHSLEREPLNFKRPKSNKVLPFFRF